MLAKVAVHEQQVCKARAALPITCEICSAASLWPVHPSVQTPSLHTSCLHLTARDTRLPQISFSLLCIRQGNK